MQARFQGAAAASVVSAAWSCKNTAAIEGVPGRGQWWKVRTLFSGFAIRQSRQL